MDVYATAAQVLPVIVLVLVVEFRLFGGTDRPGGWWASAHDLKPGERVSSWTALFVVVWLNLFFLAEILSLGAVHRGSASGFTEWVVWTALVLGFQQIIFVPTQPYVEILLDRTPATSRRYAQNKNCCSRHRARRPSDRQDAGQCCGLHRRWSSDASSS